MFLTHTNSIGMASRACVYLLTPSVPDASHGRRTYVGFTVNPARRLRQHNRELVGGAVRTGRLHLKWTLVAVVSGFATKQDALVFEWAWQHPSKSRKTREAVADLLGKRGAGPIGSVRRKMFELGRMLASCEPWCNAPFTVDVCDERVAALWDSPLAGPRPANVVVHVGRLPQRNAT